MRLTFLGATETVTGSKYLLEIDNKKVLIDCGLFQGYKKLRQRNWQSFPIAPATIDAIILTHAHIDHSGYIPVLINKGFKGRIYATAATRDLCNILLPDSGYLQEEEARLANKYGYSKHKPALPLYTKAEAIAALDKFYVVPFGQPFPITSEVNFTFSRAGHILGASLVQIRDESTSILFTGDLGRPNDPIMKKPAIIEKADYMVIESTYGNKLHSKLSPLSQLEKIINQAVADNGIIVVPSFAVGRSQDMMYYLYQLKKQHKIPDIPIYLDSPMAESVTHILFKYLEHHRLSKEECTEVCAVARYVKSAEESKELNKLKHSAIIISASGMVCGGRILHHIKNFAPNHHNVILFTGFQAGGTKGSKILAGEKQVKIHGTMVPIKAKVKYLSNMSSHPDYEEMIDWLRNFKSTPRKVFITHGEPEAADSLRMLVENTFKWPCCVPDYLQLKDL